MVSLYPLRFPPFLFKFSSPMETFCCVRWSRLLCFYGIFSIGSCSTIRFVQIRCFGLGAKPQSTWRLHVRKVPSLLLPSGPFRVLAFGPGLINR
uniref:Uncharacterized protein n=1 Tax=Brassica oleracea var. oleracea TaxID=109376 RepID=A0A0D3CTS5_BRAOL